VFDGATTPIATSIERFDEVAHLSKCKGQFCGKVVRAAHRAGTRGVGPKIAQSNALLASLGSNDDFSRRDSADVVDEAM
jgi:hypothetical protein